MTGQAVGNRIKKMEDNGIIKAYSIVVDELKMGFSFTAFVFFFMNAYMHDDLLKFIATVMKLAKLIVFREMHVIF